MDLLELRTGDMIAFKNGNKLASKLVHFFTKSNVNHVAMVVMLHNRIGTGFPFVIEANQEGVQFHYLPSILAQTKDKLFLYKLTDDNIEKIDRKMDKFYQFSCDQIDKPYSKKDALLSVLDRVNERFVDADEYNNYDCSILVGGIYYEFGVITKQILNTQGFNFFHELTPIDDCNLPIFSGDPIPLN